MAESIPLRPTPEDSRERAARVSELFRNHNRMLVRFLDSKLQNLQDAREIAQEAYVRLLELERTGAVGFLRAYLFRIASNLAIDRLRSRSARDSIDAHHQDPLEDVVQEGPVEREVFAVDEMRVFWASLAELPEHYRVAFVMHRIDNLSTGEIATKIHKSERMVRRYLVHALTYCRLRLQGLTRADAQARMNHGLTANE